jgi:hypothetical protein
MILLSQVSDLSLHVERVRSVRLENLLVDSILPNRILHALGHLTVPMLSEVANVLPLLPEMLARNLLELILQDSPIEIFQVALGQPLAFALVNRLSRLCPTGTTLQDLMIPDLILQ